MPQTVRSKRDTARIQRAFVIILLLVLWGWTICWPTALANVTQHFEAPGQSIVKAQQTVRDHSGSAWQIIVFRQLYPEQVDPLYLRLVGFPGVQAVDRQQPLLLSSLKLLPPRAVLPLPFDPGRSTYNQISPEPYVAQYGLQSMIDQLVPDSDWQIEIPMQDNRAATLKIPSHLIQEWIMVAQHR